MKPKILIVGTEQKERKIECRVNQEYYKILFELGAIPIILPIVKLSTEELEGLIADFDGLLLIGGQDICPNNYGQHNKSEQLYENLSLLKPDVKRDMLEISLYHLMKQEAKPILGICRGMQIINVAEGGDLKQNLQNSSINHQIEEDGWINYHEIIIDEKSKLFKLLGRKEYQISSVHHQAIGKLGDGLQVSARALDNIIEGIECCNNQKFILGIQGHCEKILKNYPLYKNIFKEFILLSKKIKKLEIID
ncbi:gamma-glutamyl-gamma-aminobutyrate hydrolase family protein [Enterococcus sp. UD-01]|jgi:putative glutamine amidotransferase|uniref:gamma-glutamyl-gamma-aminobutyrate hydrolase family protein n=1 Tax=Enterococcus sp. UD-01 TaxID=3373911 RepID=UPI003832E8F9